MVLTIRQRLDNMTAARDALKRKLAACELQPHLPGRYEFTPKIERWRSLVAYCANIYCQQSVHRNASPYEIDMHLAIVKGESGGDHLAICKVEWIGPEPPGYNPADPSTRATGLCQHVPAFFVNRALAALGRPGNIFDPVDQLLVMSWLIYNKPAKAPNWGHWPDAPTGAHGSATKAAELLAPLYAEAERS